MRFFIGSIIFILGYFLTYASEPLLLSGIPLKTGYVFRGIGPEEAAKVVGGKTIEPFRIASGQFTPEEVEDFFKKSSPQKIASMFSLHQTGVDALDFPSNLPDNLITRMFDGTEEGFALQKQLLQSGKAIGMRDASSPPSSSSNPCHRKYVNLCNDS